jgi:hypothetical protein
MTMTQKAAFRILNNEFKEASPMPESPLVEELARGSSSSPKNTRITGSLDLGKRQSSDFMMKPGSPSIETLTLTPTNVDFRLPEPSSSPREILDLSPGHIDYQNTGKGFKGVFQVMKKKKQTRSFVTQ